MDTSYNCKKHRIGLEPMSSGRTDSSDVLVGVAVGIVPGTPYRKLEIHLSGYGISGRKVPPGQERVLRGRLCQPPHVVEGKLVRPGGIGHLRAGAEKSKPAALKTTRDAAPKSGLTL
jgi:hypothetical protein